MFTVGAVATEILRDEDGERRGKGGGAGGLSTPDGLLWLWWRRSEMTERGGGEAADLLDV